MSEAPENPAPEVPPQVGAVLAAARREQGMSVADVAHQMKLSVSQVEALEADDFERLPGNIFVRGFVRNYARLLGLDPDPLLAAVGKIYAAAPSVHKSPTLKMIPFPSQGMTSWQKYAAAGVVVAVALLVYQALRDESVQPVLVPPNTAVVEAPPAVSAEPVPAPVTPAPQPPATQAPAATPPTTTHEAAQPMKQPEKAATAPEGKQTAQQAVRQPEPPAKPVAAAPQPAKPPEKAKVEKVVAEKAVAETKPAAPVMAVPGTVPVEPAKNEPAIATEPTQETAAGKRGSVQLHFEQDTWVVVKAEDGRVIYSRNHVPAGTHQSVRVITPFSVIIGNAAGSKVEFNHRPIDLAPYTKDGVVRLTISK